MPGEINFTHRLTPRLHQKTAWETSREREYFALLMDMGTGKTKVIIDTAAWLWKKGLIDGVLVVAPKGVYRNWGGEWTSNEFANPNEIDQDLLPELPKHMAPDVPWRHAWHDAADSKSAEGIEKLIADEKFAGLRILAVNAESLPFLSGYKPCETFLKSGRVMMVVDESTCIKHESALRTKNVVRLGRLARFRRILCGNPFANSPLDIYAPCKFLSPLALGFTSFFAFKGRFAKLVTMKVRVPGKVDKFGRPIERKFQKIDGFRDLDVLRSALAPFSFICKKDECLDLPPKVFMPPIDVEMTPRQAKVYADMKKYSVSLIDQQLSLGLQADQEIDDDLLEAMEGYVPNAENTDAPQASVPTPGGTTSASITLTQILRLQQIACGFTVTDDGKEIDLWTDKEDVNPRVQALLDLLENHEGKAVVFCNFRRNVDEVQQALSHKYGKASVARYDGTITKSSDLIHAVRSFQDPSSQVRWFLANEAKGSRGITCTAASLVVYFSNSFDNEIREQSEDRVHRDGLRHVVSYADLRVRGSVDEKATLVLKGKKTVAEMLRDGSWRSLFD